MNERSFKKPYTHTRFVSRKDYRHVLGAAISPPELLFLTPVLDQGFENSCTAYAAVAIRQSMTGRAYDPEAQWKLEQLYTGGAAVDGVQLKDQLETGRTMGFVPIASGTPTGEQGKPSDKAFAYFFPPDTSFDGIKQTLAQIKAPLSAGLNWFASFDTPDGIVPHIQTGLLGGHDVKIAGYKTINGIEYLVVQNSWGEGHGDKGLFYFDRYTTENYLGKFGVGYWSDDPKLPIKRYGVLLSLMQNAIALIQKLFVRTTGAFPPPVPPAPHVSRIADWAKAVQVAEGWSPTSVSFLHNNPGNLKYTTLTASWGATQGHRATDGGAFCQFTTYEQGFTALCNFLTLGAENELLAFHHARTIRLFTKIFACPPNDNYAKGVATALKVDIDYPIANLL